MNYYQEKMMATAMSYADRGWAIFPTQYNKKPLIAGDGGFLSATKDKKIIKQWWNDYPKAQLGIATGEVSDFWVIDVDMKDGKDGVKSLLDKFGDMMTLQNTMMAVTASGGYHLLYKWDPKVPVSCAIGILDGIDIRGNGGYIQAAPSQAIIDKKYVPYRWKDEEMMPNDAPDWALIAGQMTGRKSDGTSSKGDFNVENIMRGLTSGERDNEIYRYACHLSGRDVPYELAEAFIKTAAQLCTPPFDVVSAIEKLQYAYSNKQDSQSAVADLISNIKAGSKNK